LHLKIFSFFQVYTELSIHHTFGYQSTKWQITRGKGKQGMTSNQYQMANMQIHYRKSNKTPKTVGSYEFQIKTVDFEQNAW
jgi:hypothetical protein